MTADDTMPVPTYDPNVIGDAYLEMDRIEPGSSFPGDWCNADDVRSLIARIAKLEEVLRRAIPLVEFVAQDGDDAEARAVYSAAKKVLSDD